MSQICVKLSSQLLRTQSGVFKLLILANRQYQTQKLFIHFIIKDKESSKPFYWNDINSKSFIFLFDKWQKNHKIWPIPFLLPVIS